MTEPARELAMALAIDTTLLPQDRLITTETVQRIAAAAADGARPPQQATAAEPEPRVDASAIIVYGAGGHGKTLVELLRALRGYRIVGVIDDAAPVDDVFGVPVLGGADQLVRLRAQGIALAVNAVGTIGSPAARLRVSTGLQRAGFVLPVLVHPSAVVEQSATLAGGAQVLALSYVGSDATVGTECIVNTGAVVSHDCALGQHVHLAPGAMVAGGAQIGDRALIGMGATVYVGVRIGSDARIGNGAHVHADVPDSAVVPTGSVWPR